MYPHTIEIESMLASCFFFWYRSSTKWYLTATLELDILNITLYPYHYSYGIMGTIASQTTSLTIVYSTIYSDADQRKHQSSASLAFVWGIHRGPVNSTHKWPVTQKMFPFDDVIIYLSYLSQSWCVTDCTKRNRLYFPALLIHWC